MILRLRVDIDIAQVSRKLWDGFLEKTLRAGLVLWLCGIIVGLIVCSLDLICAILHQLQIVVHGIVQFLRPFQYHGAVILVVALWFLVDEQRSAGNFPTNIDSFVKTMGWVTAGCVLGAVAVHINWYIGIVTGVLILRGVLFGRSS